MVPQVDPDPRGDDGHHIEVKVHSTNYHFIFLSTLFLCLMNNEGGPQAHTAMGLYMMEAVLASILHKRLYWPQFL